MLKAPEIERFKLKRLKLEYDKLLSGFAFNFNLRRYIEGNPSWTEEGHLGAWHMMLRSKTGQIYMRITAGQMESAFFIAYISLNRVHVSSC